MRNITDLRGLSVRMQMLQERHTLDGPIALGLRIIKNRRVIRLVLTVAIALGIAAGVRIDAMHTFVLTNIMLEHVQLEQ